MLELTRAMVVARMPSESTEIPVLCERLSTAGIAYLCRGYKVAPPSPLAGAHYTMIIVVSGPGSRAMEAFDLVNPD